MQNQSSDLLTKKKTISGGGMGGFTIPPGELGIGFCAFVALVGSIFIYGYCISKDMELLSALPMSKWLFEPQFWKVAIELTILGIGLAAFAMPPVNMGITGVFFSVTIAYLLASAISVALSPEKEKKIKPPQLSQHSISEKHSTNKEAPTRLPRMQPKF